ncbi:MULTISPECIES: undecaprenyl-diphosphate phosphatase [Mesotoga]|uniref:undecaprenyl-diphosphate phosphatase n=2 Tax=Kosmotogaceae TaxID=1643948 RepID=UPI001BD51D80|nr:MULTISPECIES: undecaprenyl-diphosphate phosphatase [Mesotoga]MCP5457942.1 undecaprenyl-diphosphate phosphatase [Thermotogota bacterium]HOP36959.1 undecaprenyl-diphosphate phosphatase [Mesotoga prima]HOZ98786.1 undecaprenyl-diphosphate phosphatase [Mesotoga prima]HPE52904.1 undecaprenyl-diphosphate phosphatase [Mesotoga prima]HPQ90654.1 undecaprenyl-diphosphate phosphatase [Mesotoga prima]
MSETLSYLILGAVQGATEFLPVSSSGHLTIFSSFLKVPLDSESKAAFFAVLHLATFFAVLLFTFKDIWGILTGLSKPEKRKISFRFIVLLLVATIPAVLVGFLLEDEIKSLFSDVAFASIMLFATAAALFISDSLKGERKILDLSIAGALSIGIFQAAAIAPGLSRSGLTIFGALLIGMTRSDAVRFSFLLSLPVTFGAGILELSKVSLPISTVLLSCLLAFSTGIVGLWLLKKLVLKRRLRFFGFYCIIIGIVGLIFRGVM